jgi:hypothetical protein
LVDDIVGIRRGWGWFPQYNITDDGWDARKVPTDGGEIEGCDCKDEALQCTILDPAAEICKY